MDFAISTGTTFPLQTIHHSAQLVRRTLGGVFAATLLLGMLLAATPAHGQSLAGLAALSGTVRDSTGALIMDAAVTVSNPNLGIDRKITTNSEGYFISSSLPPASGHEVTVTKTGFTGFSAKNVQLMVGQNITIPVYLLSTIARLGPNCRNRAIPALAVRIRRANPS